MQIKIEIKNLDKIRASLLKSPQIVGKHIQKAINESIIELDAEGKRRTPVDTGRLRNSYEQRYGRLYGEIYVSASYAIYVHEMLRNRHKVGEAKFLENAINFKKETINQYFNSRYKDALNEIAR
jgi:hypothetical protein